MAGPEPAVSQGLPELRIDPLSGHRAIVAGYRARAAGGELSAAPPDPIDPAGDPFAEGNERPHAAGGLRRPSRGDRARHAGVERAGRPEPLPGARRVRARRPVDPRPRPGANAARDLFYACRRPAPTR